MANAMLKNIDPSSILSASQKNNVALVVRLVTNDGVDPNYGNMVGQTALHIASLWGNVETVGALLNVCGANVNVQNKIGQMTPLHCAIRGTYQSYYDSYERRLEVVTLLPVPMLLLLIPRVRMHMKQLMMYIMSQRQESWAVVTTMMTITTMTRR
jgi:hypothetical protein